MNGRDGLPKLNDRELLLGLARKVAEGRINTAETLAYIAEVEVRQLFLREGYPTMHEYCVRVLHFSDDAAYKRTRAARVARQFPEILGLLAEGKLHLSAIVLVARHLTKENAKELIVKCIHKRRSEIERFLAERFPQADVPTCIRALPVPPIDPVAATAGGRELAGDGSNAGLPSCRLAPGPKMFSEAERQGLDSGDFGAPGSVRMLEGTSARLTADGVAPSTVAPATRVPFAPSRVTPLAPRRFAIQVTVDESTHDLLRQAQALLSHQIPSRDVSQVLHRALELLVRTIEKRKFGATNRPRARRRGSQRVQSNPRHIPAAVRRAVHQRDGGRCTFVSESGHRCEARERLEFDHVREVARGGESTAANLRLRCRAHNQYAAGRAFGAGFMDEKRREARGRAERTSSKARQGPNRAASPGPKRESALTWTNRMPANAPPRAHRPAPNAKAPSREVKAPFAHAGAETWWAILDLNQ